METKFSLYNKFTPVTFEAKDSIKSKMQAVEDFWKDVETNKKEYYSSIDVAGIPLLMLQNIGHSTASKA